MNDFDSPSSPTDAAIQRALRVAWAKPSPDFGLRAVAVSAVARQAALDRVRDSAVTSSGSLRRWAAAAVLVFAVGVLGFALDLFGGRDPDGDPRAPTDVEAEAERVQDVELDADDELKVWNPGDFERGLAILTTAHVEVRPVYRVVRARERGKTRSIEDAEVRVALDARAQRDLVAALLAADSIKALVNRPHSGRRQVLDLRFRGRKWCRPVLYDAKKSGCLVLAVGSLWYRFRVPASLAPVLEGAATEMSQRWVYVRRTKDLEDAPRSLRAVVIDGAEGRVDIGSLAGFSRLRSVEIQGMIPSAALLRRVAEVPSLRFLQISLPFEESPTALGLAALAPIRRLPSLSVSYGRLDPQEIAAIRGLRELSLNECELKDPGLSLLSQLPLRVLTMYESYTPSVSELRSLRESVTLRQLRVRVGSQEHFDALFESAKAMPRLRKLHFEYALEGTFQPQAGQTGRGCESLEVQGSFGRR